MGLGGHVQPESLRPRKRVWLPHPYVYKWSVNLADEAFTVGNSSAGWAKLQRQSLQKVYASSCSFSLKRLRGNRNLGIVLHLLQYVFMFEW